MTIAVVECDLMRKKAKAAGKKQWGMRAMAAKHGYTVGTLQVMLSEYSRGRVKLNENQRDLEKQKELDIETELRRTERLLLEALKASNDKLDMFVKCLKNGRLGIPDIERFRMGVINLTDTQSRIHKALLNPTGPKKNILKTPTRIEPVLLSKEESKMYEGAIHASEMKAALEREMAKIPKHEDSVPPVE
jgi:hypothetical protein